MLAEAQRRGVVRNHVICIGDVAAYCADARETVQAVRDVGCVVVPGVTWVNAAVVGMPPNDGRAETRCATLEGVPR